MKEVVLDVHQNIEKFYDQMRGADQVVITLVCSDSRMQMPVELVPIVDTDGKMQKVFFLPIPTIGGGAPSQSRLKNIIDDLALQEIDRKKIRILVTQHGTDAEIHEQHDTKHVSCGLRKFFLQNETGLRAIRTELLAWGSRYEQKVGGRVILDGLSLDIIQTKNPELFSQIEALATNTSLPRRLILRAAYRNSDFGIQENGLSVHTQVSSYLLALEFADIFSTCLVGFADFDHNGKSLHFPDSPSFGLGWSDQKISLTDYLAPRDIPHQDPQHGAIIFGRKLLALTPRVLMPELAKVPDNIFRSSVTTNSEEIFLCALAEMMYAVIHMVKAGDGNFRSLSTLHIFCEDETYAQTVKNAMQSKEYQQDFAPLLKKFEDKGGGIILHIVRQ